MIRITINEGNNDYIEVVGNEGNSTASTRIYRKEIEKYQRGELKNDPMKMAESAVRQTLKDVVKRKG